MTTDAAPQAEEAPQEEGEPSTLLNLCLGVRDLIWALNTCCELDEERGIGWPLLEFRAMFHALGEQNGLLLQRLQALADAGSHAMARAERAQRRGALPPA